MTEENNATLKVMTFNSRSLRNKTIGVTGFLTENMCDVCFITEAWLKLKDKSIIAEIKDMGYNIKFQPRKGKGGGGVCVLFKDDLDVQKSKIGSKYKSFEVMEVIIKSGSSFLRVATFYRTGHMTVQSRNAFTNELDDYLQILSQKKGECILCGDFNIHVEHENMDKHAFYAITESYGYSQLVTGSTHCDGGTLDLIFAMNESKNHQRIAKTLFIYDLKH